MFQNVYNEVLLTWFKFQVKRADASPNFEKQNRIHKKCYSCFSVIPLLLKVFKRIIFEEIGNIMNTKFSPYLFGLDIVIRTYSLETRAEATVLRSSVENQAILEPIRLYRASKCKQI